MSKSRKPSGYGRTAKGRVNTVSARGWKPGKALGQFGATIADFFRWRRFGRYAFIGAVWVGVALTLMLAFYAIDLPDPRQAVALKKRPAITILAADGSTIAHYGDLYGSTVTVDQLPKYVPEAVIATEDQRFYHHFGLDPIGVARAMLANWRAGHLVQGGSTLTQQLAKNLFLSPDRTFKRKVQEAMLAVWIEHLYTKDQILNGYLNRVYFGGGAYGIDAASHTYFGKPATGLSLGEAAMLAGTLKAPSHYSPSSESNAALLRQQVVLERMVDAGYITPAEVQALNSQPPVPPRKPGTGDGYRYFTDWLVDQIGGYVGQTDQDLVVETTFSPALERDAEHHLEDVLAGRQAQAAHATQGAVVTIAHDGAIQAMVGGREYGLSQFNRATQALRQPGSSFKPIYYLAALQAGMTPDSTVEDAPIEIGDWSPENFEPGYRGSIPLREALAYSINTAAVRVLEFVGIGKARDMAHRLGISETLGKDYSLALGTSEVTLLEMTGVYATFGNDGELVHPYAIRTIRDRGGRLLYEYKPARGDSAAMPWHVSQLVSMLESVIDYGTGRGAKLDRPAAGKTGTSQDYRDAWFLGFTGDYTTGVWIGNDDNSPMRRITGGSLPVQVWRGVMADAEKGKPERGLSGLSATPPAPVEPVATLGDGQDGGSAGSIEGIELSEAPQQRAVAPTSMPQRPSPDARRAGEDNGEDFSRLIDNLTR